MNTRKSQNKIVVDYDGAEQLVLLAVRDLDNNEYELSEYAELGFDIVPSFELTIDELLLEKTAPEFKNREGFVIKFDNNFRVKVKYDEYFRLHKLITNINERFVWEFLSENKEIILDNIPDETFNFIKETKLNLTNKFNEIYSITEKIYLNIINELWVEFPTGYTRRDFALKAIQHNKYSSILFALYNNNQNGASKIIWKMIRPKYVKGISGFQSMKN